MDKNPIYCYNIILKQSGLKDHLKCIIIKMDQKGEYFQFYNIYNFLPSKQYLFTLQNILLEKYNTFKINYLVL